MMKRCFTVAALVCSVLAVTAHACLWDRDTLAAEARGLPGITEIITGRFDRFPALFYEMRLERVVGEIQPEPDNLDLYDDAGVACDRLGRSDEAIGWMERKLGVMDRLEASGVDVGEHRYRYLANLGTFYIHRWLKTGAVRESMADVERSRELIAAAIELNPEAHFGRERYQLLAIEWILNLDQLLPGTGQTILNQISQYNAKSGSNDNELESLGYPNASQGLSGLIALGSAWESLDIYYALAYSLGDRDDASTAKLCMIRVRELADNQNLSLYEDFDYVLLEITPGRGQVDPNRTALINEWYSEARVEADDWVSRRNAYISERLGQGSHPDSNPDFWIDWEETTTPPMLPGEDSYSRPAVIFATAVGIVLLFGFLIYRVILNRSSRAV